MYVKNEVDAMENSGIYVLDRLHKPDSFVVDKMTDLFKTYVSLSKRDRVENKINARKVASKADWKFLIKQYIKAHDFALDNLGEK